MNHTERMDAAYALMKPHFDRIPDEFLHKAYNTRWEKIQDALKRSYSAKENQLDEFLLVQREVRARFSRKAEAMTTRELVDSLAPIADIRGAYDHPRLVGCERDALTDELIARHEAARHAHQAWVDSGLDPDDDHGSGADVIKAVRQAVTTEEGWNHRRA